MNIIEEKISGRKLTLYINSKDSTPLVVLNSYEEKGKEILARCDELGCKPFNLLSISELDWENDLSPWKADDIVKEPGLFTGKADAYIEELLEKIIPRAEYFLTEKPSEYIIAGYSMAGLFALYTAFQTMMFNKVVSASGALWYPGFVDYVRANAFLKRPENIYLSVGSKESKTRHKYIQNVENATKEIAEIFHSRGIETVFEFNPGNHFTEPELRIAKGIRNVVGVKK